MKKINQKKAIEILTKEFKKIDWDKPTPKYLSQKTKTNKHA